MEVWMLSTEPDGSTGGSSATAVLSRTVISSSSRCTALHSSYRKKRIQNAANKNKNSKHSWLPIFVVVLEVLRT